MLTAMAVSLLSRLIEAGSPSFQSFTLFIVTMFNRLIKDSTDKEAYVYNGKYWETRREPGFKTIDLPKLW
jgi:hypothetical protein